MTAPGTGTTSKPDAAATAVTAAEAAIETDAKAEVTKAESWLKKFAYQFAIGFVVGGAIVHFIVDKLVK
jgi:hypothetical protein